MFKVYYNNICFTTLQMVEAEALLNSFDNVDLIEQRGNVAEFKIENLPYTLTIIKLWK